MKAADFLAAGVASEDLPISYRNCCVATASETIVGSANVFPTDALKNEDYAFVPSDRIDHIRSMLELQDWGSMFLNSLAVSEAHRGSGIGIRLLGWARTRAREAGFDCTSGPITPQRCASTRRKVSCDRASPRSRPIRGCRARAAASSCGKSSLAAAYPSAFS
jgi:GNAT superfamily N-acetyltransferase